MANSDKARAGAKEPAAADDDLDPDIDVGEQNSSPDGEESPDPGSDGSSGSEEDAQGSVALPDEGRQGAEESVEGPDERRSGEPGADDDSDAEPTASEPVDPEPDSQDPAPDPAESATDSDESDADTGTETAPASGDPVGPAPSGFNGRTGWTSAAWIPEPEDLRSGAADRSGSADTHTDPDPEPDPTPAVAEVPAASAPASPLPGGGPDLIPVEPEGSGVTVTETERPDPGRPKKAVRRAHLTLSRIEPWSVMKFSFIISLVCFIILAVAVAVVYVILDSLGVFDAMTELITSLTESSDPEDSFEVDPAAWFSAARVFGFTALVGALNVILITALSTVGAMLYNLAADLVGGLDITLSESE